MLVRAIGADQSFLSQNWNAHEGKEFCKGKVFAYSTRRRPSRVFYNRCIRYLSQVHSTWVQDTQQRERERKRISNASAGGSRLASLDRDASRNDSRRSTMHDGGMTSWGRGVETQASAPATSVRPTTPPLWSPSLLARVVSGQDTVLPETDVSNLEVEK